MLKMFILSYFLLHALNKIEVLELAFGEKGLPILAAFA
jgi:hypothetical protein